MANIIDVDYWSNQSNWKRIGSSNYVGGPLVDKPADWAKEAKIQRGGNLATYKGQTFNLRDVPSGQIQYATFSDNPSFMDSLAEVALPLALAFVPGLQGLSAALGSAIAPAAMGAVQSAIGSAIIGGTMAEAQGGEFIKGALTSGASSALGNLIAPELIAATGSNTVGQALTSGALAELQGGDFLQGAIQGGISGGINDAKLSLASDYLDSLPGGQGPYTDAPPDMSDFDLPPAVIDTSFTPDYSLFSGAPVVPDMGAQGIQVPTITELVDVVGSPVDYSLPIPGGSGLGLQMPGAPNLEAMGGGQGLVIPVDGGVITEAGFIPDGYIPDLGDPNSFINQTAPNVEVNISEPSAEQPKDISGKLAVLDLLKVIAPIAVASAFDKDQPQNPTEEQTGYPILPIPGDWKSPEYNQSFTPSAAIDFGNAGMLAGTQFARQPAAAAPSFYNLSDVINTLNFQSVPFTQQQLQMPQQSFDVPDILQQFQTPNNIGMNDFIGDLDGSPATLNSIIAGIQSQYG